MTELEKAEFAAFSKYDALRRAAEQAHEEYSKLRTEREKKDAVEREHYKSTITAKVIWNPIRDALEKPE